MLLQSLSRRLSFQVVKGHVFIDVLQSVCLSVYHNPLLPGVVKGTVDDPESGKWHCGRPVEFEGIGASSINLS